MSKNINVLPANWNILCASFSNRITMRDVQRKILDAIKAEKENDMASMAFKNEDEWEAMIHSIKGNIEYIVRTMSVESNGQPLGKYPHGGDRTYEFSHYLPKIEQTIKSTREAKNQLAEKNQKEVKELNTTIQKLLPEIDHINESNQLLEAKILKLEKVNKTFESIIEENNKAFGTKLNTLSFMVESLWNANLAMKDALEHYNIPYLTTLGEDIPSSEEDLSIITLMGDGSQSSGTASGI